MKRLSIIMFVCLLVTILMAQAPYCSSTYTNQTDDWISYVEINNISNSSGQDGPNSYGDYTYLSTDLSYGLSYFIFVTFVSNSNPQNVWVFIDWNQNEDFGDPNEAYDLGESADATLSAIVSVPYTALPGNTCLRVIEQYSTDPGPCDPHQNIYGETEDYTINIPANTNDWMGTVDSNWHNPANWLYNFVPDASTDVNIYEAPYKCWIYDSDAECNNLHISYGLGANFFKVFDEDLHIYGDLDINGKLILDHPAGNLIVEGDVLWQDGSTAYFPYYDEFIVYGDWYFFPYANVQINSGIIEFAGIGGNYIYSYNDDCYFNNISCNKTGGGWLSVSNASTDDLNIHGDITNQSGCNFYSFTPVSINLQGSLYNSGIFECYNGAFTCDGNNQVISGNLSLPTITSFNKLTISSTTNTLIENGPVDVKSHLTIESGIITTDETIWVGGNWNNLTGSTGLLGIGIVEFNGGNYDQLCSNENFFSLRVNKSTGGTLKISGTEVICSIYDWTAGGIDVDAGGSFTAYDLWDDGIFGTYYLSPQSIINLTNNDGYVDLNGNLNISGGTMNIYGGTRPSYWSFADNASIIMSDGILDFHNQGIRIDLVLNYDLAENITGGTIRTTGSFNTHNYLFSPEGGTVEFYDDTEEAYISNTSTSHFHNVIINKGSKGNSKSNMATLEGLLDINGNLTIISGILHSDGNDIKIEGDWTNNVGDEGFVETSGYVLFNGEDWPEGSTIYTDETFSFLKHSSAAGGSYGLTFAPGITVNVGDLELLWSALEMDIGSSLYVGGDLYIAFHAGLNADDGNNIITVGGNWTNENYSNTEYYGFWPGGETVTFNGLSDQQISTFTTHEEFTNIIIDKNGGSFLPNNNILISNELLISNGTWQDNTSGLSHNFLGDFTINSTGNYYPGGLTIFGGSSDQYYTSYGGLGFFGDVIVDKSSKDTGSKSLTLFLNSDMVIFNDHSTVIARGTLNLNGHIYKATGNVEIHDGGNLIVDAGAKLSMNDLMSVQNGGTFTTTGTPGNNATVYANGSGEYAIVIELGGTISSSYTTFEDISEDGLWIHNGAFIDPVNSFNNCSLDGYTNPSGSTWLIIGNDQDITIDNISFPNNPGGAFARNINKYYDYGQITLTNASGDFSGPAFEYDPYDRIDWVAPEIELSLKVFLEGPFNGVDMNTDLNGNPELAEGLPLSQPYNIAPWNYEGTETVVSIPNTEIVDWLLIELRNAIDAPSAFPETKVAQKAVFLKSDGSIVNLDGSSNPEFYNLPTDHLFLVIQHRNHLGIMSANPVTESGGISTYDFTTPADQAHGTNSQKNLDGGIYGMFGGDANADGDINTDDKIIWANQAGTQGYKSADFNMNGQIENQDKNDIWGQNTGISSQLPTPPWQCGDDLIDTRDEQSYTTVQIGIQCWMAENLNIGTMINGTTSQTDNSTIEKYCYSNNTSNCDTYGGLYQWNEMMEYSTTPGVQGICPPDWHLPTDAEWCTLENEVDAGTVSCSALGWRGTDVGGNLKETGTTHWKHPNIGATNSSGFTALGCGYRKTNGTFGNLTWAAYFWSSNVTGSAAWDRRLWHGYIEVNRYYGSKALGYSVRCLQD